MADEIRLVPTQMIDGRLCVPGDYREAWNAGITEEEMRALGDSPALLSPLTDEPGTFPYRVAQATKKLRAVLHPEHAASTPGDGGNNR